MVQNYTNPPTETEKKSQAGSRSRAAEFTGALGRAGGAYVRYGGGYGARRRGPARWPWQMTLVSLFLEDTGVRRHSTSVIKYSVREGRALPVS